MLLPVSSSGITRVLTQVLRPIARRLLPLCLAGVLLLAAGSATAGSLSGDYQTDTVTVADSLLATIELQADDPGRSAAELQARGLMNEYVARYRPRRAVNGLSSFTTMQTALNSLAGHYANYPNRPLAEKLKARLRKELNSAETSAARGA